MALCARTWFMEALQCLRLVTLWHQDGIWEGQNTKDLGDAMMCDENGAMGQERNHQFLSRDDKLKQTLQKRERSFYIDCRKCEIWNWQCDGKGKIESTLKAWGFRRNPIQMEFRHNRQAPIQTHGHETQRNKLEHFKRNRLFKKFCSFLINAWWQRDIFNKPKQLSTHDLPYDRSLK